MYLRSFITIWNDEIIYYDTSAESRCPLHAGVFVARAENKSNCSKVGRRKRGVRKSEALHIKKKKKNVLDRNMIKVEKFVLCATTIILVLYIIIPSAATRARCTTPSCSHLRHIFFKYKRNLLEANIEGFPLKLRWTCCS